MHNVYLRPEDVRAYRKDGHFPDGTVLVKEITNVSSDKLTTGHSSWSTDVKLWFVMIKDSKGRFPGNDLWGDGWGWALFMAKEPCATWRLTTRPIVCHATFRPRRTTGSRGRLPDSRRPHPGPMKRILDRRINSRSSSGPNSRAGCNMGDRLRMIGEHVARYGSATVPGGFLEVSRGERN